MISVRCEVLPVWWPSPYETPAAAQINRQEPPQRRGKCSYWEHLCYGGKGS